MSGITYLGADLADATFAHAFRLSPAGASNTVTVLTSNNTANRILTFPDADDVLVGRNTADTLTQKTIVGGTASNDVTANKLAGGVNILGTPNANDILTATSATTAVWTAGFLPPAGTTDNAIARFDGTAGSIQNSTVILGDTGSITGVDNLAAVSVDISPSIANPGGADTFWNGPLGLMHNMVALENYNPFSLYVSDSGRFDGAGGISDPLDSIATALTRTAVVSKIGAEIHVSGTNQFPNLLLLPPNVIITGNYFNTTNLSGATTIGSVDCTDPSWSTLSGLNENKSIIRGCGINGSFTFDTNGKYFPYVTIDDCLVQGNVAVSGDNFTGGFMIKNSQLNNLGISITNANAFIVDCKPFIYQPLPVNINIICNGLSDMVVYLSNLSENCTLDISQTGTAFLTVYILGRATANISAVAGLGLLRLYIDDCAITYAPGTEALTLKTLVKDSKVVSYDGTVSGITAVNVQDAIDELIANAVVPATGAVDKAIVRFNGTTGQLIENPSPNPVLLMDTGTIRFPLGNDQLEMDGANTILGINSTSRNVILGYGNQSSSIGTDNTTVGCTSGTALTTGIGNTIVGSNIGTNIDTGNGNIIVGGTDTLLQNGNGNVHIGCISAGASDSNSIAINGASGGTNSTVIGNGSTNLCTIYGISSATVLNGSTAVRLNPDASLCVAYSNLPAHIYFENDAVPHSMSLSATPAECAFSTSLENWDSAYATPGSGRISWNRPTALMLVDAMINYRLTSGGPCSLSFHLSSNGSLIVGSRIKETASSTVDWRVIRLSALLRVFNGDYISVFIANNTSIDGIDIRAADIRLSSV